MSNERLSDERLNRIEEHVLHLLSHTYACGDLKDVFAELRELRDYKQRHIDNEKTIRDAIEEGSLANEAAAAKHFGCTPRLPPTPPIDLDGWRPMSEAPRPNALLSILGVWGRGDTAERAWVAHYHGDCWPPPISNGYVAWCYGAVAAPPANWREIVSHFQAQAKQ